MRCVGEAIEQLDAEVASRARAETALRLRLGQALEVLSRGGHSELGFSSMAAYALERCDRSVRWVDAARCLGRRLQALPELRRAMAFGIVSWSMGELLARVAQSQDEVRWIETARSRTVREMRGIVLEAMAGENASGGAGSAGHAAMLVASAKGQAENAERLKSANQSETENGLKSAEQLDGAPQEDAAEGEEDSEAMSTLTCTVDREEAWLFEATRALLEQLGTRGADAQVEALLAEGQGTLLAALPAGTLDMDRLESMDTGQRRWLHELSRWRAEAEVLCEEHVRSSVVGSGKPDPVQSAVAVAAALGMASLEGMGCSELDGTVRDLSRALARHELELSRLVLGFHRADGWRRLGYATETQYARERLGLSRSSLVARRALAVRLEALPRVAEALGAGQIGVEAAMQIVRVATPSTEAAWVERARRRTIKLLREEVAAALTAVRLSGEPECPPPVDAEMVAFHALEQAVVSGRACQPQPASARCVNGAVDEREPANDGGVNGAVDEQQRAKGAVDEPCPANAGRVNGAVELHLVEPASEQRRAWLVMLSSLARWLEGGLQMSAGQLSAGEWRPPAGSVGSSAGRVALRLRVSRSTYGWWRGLEGQARRWLPCGMSWLRFLCLSLWEAWRHLLGTDVEYGQIYIRDGFRCTIPVCSRKDFTPHHIQFRSAGGSDEDRNVTSACTWCHLYGIHGGHIRAAGSADLIHWELGPRGCPCVVVHGRERVAA